MGPTLPDLGVDVTEYVTLMGTQLGGIFVAVLAVSIVFITGKIGWRWLKRAGA